MSQDKTRESVSYVNELISKNVTTNNISASTGYIEELTSNNITAESISADHATIQELDVESMSAATAYIRDLTSENITAEDIAADHATVSTLDSTYATINELHSDYAEIDLANVNNAWIENGAMKKAEVFDENVFDLSGDHATISRIDASKINVANLNADNLIVRRINGQPVVGGYTLISPSSSGYASKNPRALGWYEFVNAQFVLSTDTTADMTKAYYQTGNEVSLYDQTYIDGMKNSLQQQIDGAVETFTGSVVPTLTNYPYNEWYDTSVTPVHDERAKHVGDIYYVINSSLDEDGYCYRFAYDNTTHAYSWVLIKDSDVTKALSDISDLQTFESETTSWIDETDEGLETIRTNYTALSGTVDKTVKESIQLWFTKANTTAPNKPNSTTYPNGVTDTSTAGNGWRVVVPAWNASYPNYFYCWQYKFVDGTFGWSNVVRDIAMGETQGVSRDAKNTADNALPASTFTSFESTTFKDVKDTVTEQSTKFTNMTTRLGMNADGTGANTDIVAKESALEQTVDGISTRVGKTETKLIGMYATSSTAANARAKVATIVPTLPNDAVWELTSGTMVTVKFVNANTYAATSTYPLTLNVNSKGAKPIKTYSNGDLSEAEYKWAAGSTFTFVYNGTSWLMQDSSVSVRIDLNETKIDQTATSIESLASNQTNYTKPDGTTAANAIKSAITQTANSIESVVANNTTYTAPDGTTKINTIQSAIKQNEDDILLRVEKSGVIAAINASVEEQGGSAVKISADKVNITGTAVFNAVNNDTSASAAMLNSNIEIGGRNLLSKTKEFTTDNTTGFYMTGHNAPFSSATYNGLAVRSYPSTTLSSGSKVVMQYDVESIAKTQELIKLGETYVCSFWAKGSGKMNLYFYRDPAIASWVASDGTTGTNNDGAKVWTLSSSWERYWIAWTTNASATYTNPKRLLFRHDYSSSTATLQVDLCGIKLEKGNKATDWSPAPEDVQAEIDTKKNVHTLLSGNSSGTDYSTILGYAKEGATGTFSVNTTSTPITNVKVDDSVRLGYYVSDMGTAGNRPLVYINATVTAIPSATQITIKAHGLDTTIIDGGNIITNSIGANQLNTNNINNSGLLTTGALTVGARSDVLNSNIQVGGRNLFGYGSQCKALDGFWTVGAWNIATEDGYQCAHTSGAKSETRYLQSKLPFYPRPNETVAISAFVKVKNISYGTTNPMCEFYIGGQTIDGTWRSQSIDAIYVDGVKVAVASTNPVRFTNYISDTNWHHIALVRTWQNYAFTDNMLPSVYLRDATGDLYVRNIKYERGNKATDWTPAPEDVDAGIANAANTANSYISVIDGTTGISVHNASDTNNFVNINSDGMKVYKGGATDSNVVASFEDTVTIGKNNGSRVYVAPNELTMLTEDGLKAVQIDSDGATQTVVKQNELHLKFRDGVTPSSGTSVTHTVSSEVQSGENVYYQVYSKAAQTGHWTTVSIKKGTASSGTVSNGSTNLYTYSYAGNSTSQTITFTGANILFDHEVMTEYYRVTQIAPKTSIGGILTLGQNSDVSNGDNVLVVGNGSDPQFPYNTFEVRQDGITMVRNDLYVDGFIYANYATHNGPIGTIVRGEPSAAVSVPDKTFKALCSVSLDAGTWIVICTVRAPSNATGFRIANLATTAAVNACNACIPAVSANVTQFDFTKIVEPTEPTPYYLNVYHNAGTSLIYPTGSTNYITAIRIL